MPEIESSLLKQFPVSLVELVQKAPLPGLDGRPKCNATAERVRVLLDKYTQLRGTATEAAIWLLAGELDRSHEVSQGLETAEGSYWHGIMHRREGDFWNAKYWFRKVGRHPVSEQLSQYLGSTESRRQFAGGDSLPIQELSDSTKVCASLVDCCQWALSSQPENVTHLQRICWLEWQFLFLYGCDN